MLTFVFTNEIRCPKVGTYSKEPDAEATIDTEDSLRKLRFGLFQHQHGHNICSFEILGGRDKEKPLLSH